jgi:hypothetical protein
MYYQRSMILNLVYDHTIYFSIHHIYMSILTKRNLLMNEKIVDFSEINTENNYYEINIKKI